MRKTLPKKLERCRVNHPLTGPGEGRNGAFVIMHNGSTFKIISSDGMGWEHISISIRGEKRTPTWDEMCYFKRLFWRDDECVIQYHPPKSDYVNVHDGCLHLWRPTEQVVPQPPLIMV